MAKRGPRFAATSREKVKAFAANLKAWRKNRTEFVTQQEVVDHVNYELKEMFGDSWHDYSISLRTYRRWEAGESLPRREALDALVEVAGVSKRTWFLPNLSKLTEKD